MHGQGRVLIGEDTQERLYVCSGITLSGTSDKQTFKISVKYSAYGHICVHIFNCIIHILYNMDTFGYIYSLHNTYTV